MRVRDPSKKDLLAELAALRRRLADVEAENSNQLRRRAECEHGDAETADRFEAAIRGCNDGIWDRDLRSGEVFFSDHCKTMLGYRPDEIANDVPTFDRLCHPDDRSRSWAAIDAYIKGNTPFFVTEFRMRHKDGSWRWILSRGAALRDEHGRPYRVAGSYTDISERKRAEEEIARSRTRLRALASELTLAEARERRRLAAALHDEVGQTLALARLKLGLLGRHLSAEGPQEVFDELRELFSQVSKRIRSLTFELSPPILYQLGLAAAIEWLAEKFEREHGVRCRVECSGSLERVEETVSILMFQSVRELLTNIGKHAQARDASITVGFAAGWVTLNVKDDGVGFAPDQASIASQKQDSFGLFSIAERMHYIGGTVQIVSAPGRGTTVTLAAPMTPVRDE